MSTNAIIHLAHNAKHAIEPKERLLQARQLNRNRGGVYRVGCRVGSSFPMPLSGILDPGSTRRNSSRYKAVQVQNPYEDADVQL